MIAIIMEVIKIVRNSNSSRLKRR